MWETRFDESMLDKHVIIHCPKESDAVELFKILHGHGIRWCNTNRLDPDSTLWNTYKGETCYWIERKELAFGSLSGAAREPEYDHYIKCTFRAGCDLPDLDMSGCAADSLLV